MEDLLHSWSYIMVFRGSLAAAEVMQLPESSSEPAGMFLVGFRISRQLLVDKDR